MPRKRLGSLAICAGMTACMSAAPQRAVPVIFRYDRTLPLDLSHGTPDTFVGYTRTAISYRSPIEGRVPADLFVPSTPRPGRRPAIIYLHGLPDSREAMAPLAAAYAKAGIIGLSLSAPFNREELSYRQGEARLIPAPLLNAYDHREMIQVAMDVSRAIDLLTADPRVDPKRIAFIGFSYGGGVGALMAAIEPRLRAVALMSPTSGLATWMRVATDSQIAKQAFLELRASEQVAWLASMDSVEPWRVLAAMKPGTPILVQAGREDRQVLPEDMLHILAAAGKHAKLIRYASGHVLPTAAQRDQAGFLASAFGVDLKAFTPTSAPIH